DLPDAVRGQILAKTGGNPFFIEEVLRALIADGTLVRDARGGHWRLATTLTTVALPDTVQAVIVARIDRLDEGGKSVLKLAAAIERLFGDRLDELTSLLAYHYALAEDWEAAQAYLFKAGDQAGRMAADAEALELYRQAEAAYARVATRELAPLQRAMLDRKLG